MDLFKRIAARARWELHKAGTRRRVAASRGPAPSGDEGTVLFFSPEADVTPHFAAHCLVARTLKELGHSVCLVQCLGVYERCPVMDSLSLPLDLSGAARDQTCYRCAGAGLRMREEYGLSGLDLRAWVTPEMSERIRASVDAAPADLLEFTFEGIPFGKITYMTVALLTKVLSGTGVGDAVRLRWLQYLRGALTSYLAVDALLGRRRIRAIVQYNDYPALVGARLAARRHRVPVIALSHQAHRGVDRTRCMFAPEAWSSYNYRLTDAWAEWRDIPLPAPLVEEVAEDLLWRFRSRGSHAYSPAKSDAPAALLQRLGLSADKPLVVAFTSSLDEVNATATLNEGLGYPIHPVERTFASQIEWLEALTAHVEADPSLQLAVRIHPREGANRRDKVPSEHLARLRERFDRPFARCRFIWPGDAVSSYDLGELADAVLVSWSSIGLEMARLGVPVLASTLGVSNLPADDFLPFEAKPDAYFRRLTRMLRESEVALDVIARAFRCYHAFKMASSLDLADVVPSPDFTGLPPFRMPREAKAIEAVVLGGREVPGLIRDRLLAARGPGSEGEERAALETALRSLVHFMHTGEEAAAGAVGSLEVEGRRTRYAFGGKVHERYSPLCARLAATLGASAGAKRRRAG